MIQLKNVNFTYQGAETGGLHGLDLTVPDGQVLVLCGESGCGKTTLTRLLNGLIPHVFPGELTGSVTVDGRDVSHQPLYDTARLVGSVFQNPRSQFFNVDTTSEITFGCENLGLPKDEILRRLDAAVPALGLRKLLGRGIFQLSGGEKQKIACAGAFLMEPPVFVLDEPSANLDADAVLELRGVYLRDGRIQGDYSGAEFDAIPAEERRAMGLRAGSLADLTLREEPDIRRGTAQLRDFRFAYKNAPETLRIDEAAIPYGGIVGILGHNGAGKSTFSRCFCGLEKRRGTVTVDGTALRPKDRLDRCYMVMQDVGHQLFTESVLDEVLLSMPEEDETQAKAILDRLDLTPYLDRHPASLSGGQKQRLAVASALAAERSVVFLDEPTSGLDDRHMRETAQLLRELRRSGKTVYVITHDPELITECCTDILRLEAGEIADSYPLDEAGLAKVRAFFRVEETD